MKYLVVFFFIFVCSQQSIAANVDGIFGYSFADEFKESNSSINTQGALTAGARLDWDFNANWGMNLGLDMDMIRQFQNQSGSIGFFLLESNVVYNLTDIKPLYFFGGLNYPILMIHSHASTSGDVGFQFGTGFRFFEKAGLELYYRAVNMSINSNDAALWGFNFRIYYTFSSF